MDAAKAAGVTAEIGLTVAGSFFAPAADMPTSAQTSNPTETAVVAAAEAIEAKSDGDKMSDERDLEGVAKAEYSDERPAAEDSTFAAAAEAAAAGQGDDFGDSDDDGDTAESDAGEGDDFGDADGDISDTADSEAGEGDDFGDGDGDMSDASEADASDGDSGSDGDGDGGDGDGGDGGW